MRSCAARQCVDFFECFRRVGLSDALLRGAPDALRSVVVAAPRRHPFLNLRVYPAPASHDTGVRDRRIHRGAAQQFATRYACQRT
jgi:hypothetical protein